MGVALVKAETKPIPRLVAAACSDGVAPEETSIPRWGMCSRPLPEVGTWPRLLIMASDDIEVPYNKDLGPLEDLLAGVKRPGDFFVEGSLEAPMPRVEVEAAGVLSFPVPDAQIQSIIRQAVRAPYGRGEETILDESVRKVWQLAPDKVSIGGKSWASTFEQILAKVKEGLGCGGARVSAEFYKLLVYDEGGFFKPHRDTEKVEGMFGTLVIVLPSAHRGGELVLRHAGREAHIDLSTEEISELRFAAFYADCEHEVRPITQGNRVCLIYNLLQKAVGAKAKPLTAPLYASELTAAAKMLQEGFGQKGGPAKLAWLLEHQYSPAGLCFAGLKGADKALGQVLRQAAERAGCAAHLGIVHITESGAAEPGYSDYRPRRRWGHYYEEESEEEDISEDFEVVEVFENSRHIDNWVNAQDQPVDFGQVPLEEGEVLPAGALDGEAPDEQRLTEASGNEGATFDRAYHRAALVIWPRERFMDVLLQAGVGATLPYLRERIVASTAGTGTKQARPVVDLVRRVIEAWGQPSEARLPLGAPKEANRGEMIALLSQLGEAALLERFVTSVVVSRYDGTENEALAASIRLLGPEKAGKTLVELAQKNMRVFHWACVNLLSLLIKESGPKLKEPRLGALRQFASAIVTALPELETAPAPYRSGDWTRAQKAKPVDAAMVADLMGALEKLHATQLRAEAAKALAANPAVFDPGTILVPALNTLHSRAGRNFTSDAEALSLWAHSAQFLLNRSEFPPKPPTDWRQEAKLSCKCEDCRELQAFALDPHAKAHRFRVRKDRRQHLHRQIEAHGLDMTHVTERTGSPQTLVCTKTRRTYEGQCEQHKKDRGSMGILLNAMPAAGAEVTVLMTRMNAAKEREPEPA